MAEILSTTTSEGSAPPASGAVAVRPWRQLRQWSSTGRSAIAIRGGSWSIFGYVATQLLRIGATLVLARHFLGPEAFGLVGLVAVFLSGLTMSSELGITANVVQHRRGDDPEFLKTAFSIQAARGLAIWSVAILAAYPLALFYKLPELLPLLVVAASSEMIRGLASTAACTLNRHVKLGKLTLVTIVSEVAAFAVAMVWVVIAPSAWVLVARTIAAAAVYTVGTHLIAEHRVGFGWQRSAVKDILHFGGWISVSTATFFLAGQGERLILGKFVTPAELGCFSLAVTICAAPAGAIGQVVNQTFLPMISAAVRASHAGAVRDFLRARPVFFAAAVFTGVGFLLCGKPLVAALLNPRYEMTGWMLQILGLRIAVDIFEAPASSLVMAHGQTKYCAGRNITRAILMVTGVWVAFAMFGIREAVYALALAQVLSYFPLIVGLARFMPEIARVELRWYLLLVALLSLAGAAVWFRV